VKLGPMPFAREAPPTSARARTSRTPALRTAIAGRCRRHTPERQIIGDADKSATPVPVSIPERWRAEPGEQARALPGREGSGRQTLRHHHGASLAFMGPSRRRRARVALRPAGSLGSRCSGIGGRRRRRASAPRRRPRRSWPPGS